MKVSYDFNKGKVVFDYSSYDEDEKEVLEYYQIEIPNKDVFYVWVIYGVDQVEFNLVDNFDDKMNEIIENEKERGEESTEDDFLGVPGLRMEEESEVMNGYEINQKHFKSIYDDECYFYGFRQVTFRRL